MRASEFMVLLVTHPLELRSLLNYKIWREPLRDITSPEEFSTSGYDRESMKICWDLLDQTSRSFSRVIKELEGDLARVVCIFYLVLRATDTIEDDMTIPNATKLPHLRTMHLKLHEPGWTYNESNEKDKAVLEQFDKIQAEFAQLDQMYQVVIEDVCKKMGAGMADFAALSTPERPVAEIATIADFDLYCHYVAGLVGEGLSVLFSSSGKERPWLAQQLTLSNSMGLLLQKTNILRDVKEDVDESRCFWPRAIWGRHGFNSMKEMLNPEKEKQAMFATSEMTLDALRHATDALDYLTLLKCQSVFNFVAIPAAMALATLDLCFMNPKILKGNVKIRRGQAVRLLMRSTNPRDVSLIFREYTKSIHSKIKLDDPNLLKLSIACGKIEQWSEHHYPSFLQISGSGGSSATLVDNTSRDARVSLYTRLARETKEKADAQRREAIMEDLKARGILKDRTPEEKAALVKAQAIEESPPWMLILAAVTGILVLMVGMGLGIAYIIIKYADQLDFNRK